MLKILFVCFGNFCRSPMAQGLFTEMLLRAGLSQRVEVHSAGTHTYHLDAAPDPRAQQSLARRGIDIGHIRARRVTGADFERYDYLIAMDRQNYEALDALCPPGQAGKLRMLMDYAPHLHVQEVPDPYYGSAEWFDRVLDLIDAAAEGLLMELQRRGFQGPDI